MWFTVDSYNHPHQDSITQLDHLTGGIEDELLPVNLESPLMEKLMVAKNYFGEEPPRIIMVGKPCTGKTTLARILCNLWGCDYVNASDLVQRCIEEKSGRGLEIIRQLQQGEDLSDATVFNILHEHLQSPECRNAGYILDGIPNYSEKLLNIQTQLEFLARIYPTPSLWVMIDIPDPELRARWEGMRIDSSTGQLYSRLNYDPSVEPSGRCDFPIIDEDIKARLMIRHEELPENLDLHFRFYNENIQQPLEEFLNRFESSTVVRLDGTLCPMGLCQQLVSKLLDSSAKGISRPPSVSTVPSVEMQLPDELLAIKSIWCNEPPRLVMFGKPCAKKTTLARMLCNAWDCHYVNVTELISTHVERRTGTGLRILSLMHRHEALPDSMTFEIVSNELLSTDCVESGYILDGMPTTDEGMPSVPSQLEFLRHLLPRPRFWVYVDVGLVGQTSSSIVPCVVR
ncbi:unnamed protein product [Dicrocoelium dendriticum]|nr:unnamed protein product [Dicrocoelium dendriticum]